MTDRHRASVPAAEEPICEVRRVGRCVLFGELARGGMATVHLGRWIGGGGFQRPVAVKALHPQFASDPDFRRMLLDEARVVARIRHPNVVPIVDLVDDSGDLFIVMEYVESVTLSYLCSEARRLKQRIPPGVTKRILTGVLHGLHAAHEAKDERGRLLDVIHRDVSPDNVLVGSDGHPRIIDFGIARALGRAGVTREGWIKGKPSYLAPEQVLSEPLSRRTDVWGASVVLWQALTGRRLFRGASAAELVFKIIEEPILPPSHFVPGLPRVLDDVVLRGLSRDPADRWPTAEAMAEAIESLGGLASHRMVGEWMRLVAHGRLQLMRELVATVENAPLDTDLERTAAWSAARTSLTSLVEIDVEPTEPSRTELTSQADAQSRQAEPRSLSSFFAIMAVAAAIALLAAAGAWHARRASEPIPAESTAADPADQASAPAPRPVPSADPTQEPSVAPPAASTSAAPPQPSALPAPPPRPRRWWRRPRGHLPSDI